MEEKVVENKMLFLANEMTFGSEVDGVLDPVSVAVAVGVAVAIYLS